MKLNQGDIIVFKAEDDWLSKAIAWFTQSDASHAAMVYSEDSIVEVGAYGIGVHKVTAVPGDGVYVMRLCQQLPAAPLVESADHYLSAEVRYDFPALFILAGLLIFRRIMPDTRVFHAVYDVLLLASVKLDEAIQKKLLHKDSPAMVCSQLVYQIFNDCPEPYRIQIENGCVVPENDMGQQLGIRLYDMLTEENETGVWKALEITEDMASYIEDEQYLAKKLYEVLQQAKEENTDSLTLKPGKKEEVLDLAKHFVKGLEYFLKLCQCHMPLEALFVTPGDLVYHAKNLTQVGTLDLTRVKQ